MIYVIFIITAIFLSFKYASTRIKRTGLFLPKALIAGTIYLILSVFGALGWFFFSWKINEFLFFGGLVLGLGFFITGEVILLTIFFSKRKKWIQIYHASLNGDSN